MTTRSIRRAKSQSNYHHQEINTLQCSDTVGWATVRGSGL